MGSLHRMENASNIRNEYYVIGRCLNYAIVKNEEGNLFYIDDENSTLDVGDLCTGEMLKSVDELPGILKEIVHMSFESEVA